MIQLNLLSADLQWAEFSTACLVIGGENGLMQNFVLGQKMGILAIPVLLLV